MKNMGVKTIHFFQWTAGILFLTLFVLIVLRVTLRYFLGISWLWIPDFSRLLFIWIVFIGATVLYARHEHLAMDLFVNKIKPETLKKLAVAQDIVLVFFLFVLITRGAEVAKVRMRIPFDTWDFPTGSAYAAVPVCCTVMLLMTLGRLWDAFKKRSIK
jgi:TRAP-type C4-dicarboxylate transport system permease small subunit